MAFPTPDTEDYLYSLADSAVAECLGLLLDSPQAQAFAAQIDQRASAVDYTAELKRVVQDCSSLEQSAQALMALFANILQQSIGQLDIHGLEQLDSEQRYLFISNHRDVLLDPLLLNLALQAQHGTARCAIGSNLLEDPLLEAYLRLCGCFVVPRDDLPMRVMVQRLRQLSQHIHTLSPQHNIWIAQREGRAKDGWDITNPALIKMLLLAKPPQTSASDFLNAHKIVPLSISYEWDPSDVEKAEELALKEADANSNYRSDSTQHLLNSLFSDKGRVSLVFGQPLQLDESHTAAHIAADLDHFIQKNFVLSDSHLVAYKAQQGEDLTHREQAVLEQLQQRAGNRPAISAKLLDLYANITAQLRAATDL